VECSCEHGNESSGFIKRWDILEWLHNWWILKKGSSPWSYLDPIQADRYSGL
jgi:hypothetical protein